MSWRQDRPLGPRRFCQNSRQGCLARALGASAGPATRRPCACSTPQEHAVTTASAIGADTPRRGLAAKVRGDADYTADLKRPGMLYGRILRSPHAHARIQSIDASEALALPGVHAVLTYNDVPRCASTPTCCVLDPVVRHVGDEVAVVVAERESDRRGRAAPHRGRVLLRQPVYDAADALANGAPVLHEHAPGNLVGGVEPRRRARRRRRRARSRPLGASRGASTRRCTAPWAWRRARRWPSGTATTSRCGRPAAPSMPSTAARWPRCWTCRRQRARHLHDDGRRLRQQGRGPSGLAGSACGAQGRPARAHRVQPRRGVHRRPQPPGDRHRHPIGVDAAGAPQAIEMLATMNAGAYVASGMGVTRRIGQGAVYLYTSPNARFEGTHRLHEPPARRLVPRPRRAARPLRARGARSTRSRWRCGVDPLDYRLAHHVKLEGQPGERQTPLNELVPDQPIEGGVPFSSNSLRECLLAGAERIGWRQRRQPNGYARGPIRRGLGMAMGVYKGGGNVAASMRATHHARRTRRVSHRRRRRGQRLRDGAGADSRRDAGHRPATASTSCWPTPLRRRPRTPRPARPRR